MKRKRIYTIVLRDESRLENIATVELKIWKIAGVAISFVAISILLGALMILVTPLHYLLPGYLREDARTATEETALRLDSLQSVIMRNQNYMASLFEVLGESELSDSARMESRTITFNDESQLAASPAERNFVKRMQDGDKYNISVLAPLAAEGMMFSPVNEESVVSESSRNERVARIMLAGGAPVCAIADGSIISVNRAGTVNGYSIVIQHPRGFVSRYSQVGSPFVDQGELVTGGQAIAPSSSRGSDGILLEMWHNGSPLIPYSYIGHLVSENNLHTWDSDKYGGDR